MIYYFPFFLWQNNNLIDRKITSSIFIIFKDGMRVLFFFIFSPNFFAQHFLMPFQKVRRLNSLGKIIKCSQSFRGEH